MINSTEPLFHSDRKNLAKKVKQQDRSNAAEIRRYSVDELFDGLKGRIRADRPDLSEDEVRRKALDVYVRLKRPYAGPVRKAPAFVNTAAASARKAQRAKMKGNR